jgi:uncharacterized RDD family membrane protein YckC
VPHSTSSSPTDITPPDAGGAAGLAAPAPSWRRLAASVLDTLALLLVNALIFLLGSALAPDLAPRIPLPLIGMVIAIAYLAIGWGTCGMTLGKWALGIRVVTSEGGKLSWARALARVGAFLVASAPLKLGLAAILWDARRRGWHDHMAGTMVVTVPRVGVERSEDRAPVPQPDTVGTNTTRAEQPQEHPSRPRLGRLIAAAVLLIYILLAVGLTMPLAFNLSTQVPGAQVEGLEQDGYMFLWDYWWVRTALTHPGMHVMSTRYLFWPQEVSLRYHTLVLLHSSVAALLQCALSLIQSYNLLLLLSLAACAWGAFLLCRHVTGSTTGAAVAGLAFGFCPYMTTHALAHQNLIAAEWLAPFAYCAIRALRERRSRYVLGAGVSWALVGLCEWYYFLYGAMLLVVLLVVEIAARPRRWFGAVAVAAGAVSLGVVVLSPLLVPMLAERAHGAYMQQPLARGAALSGRPELYLIPAFTHPVFGDSATATLHSLGVSRGEGTVYLGVVVIALALIGFTYRRRALVPWTAGAVFFLLLALGPHLNVVGRSQFNALALLLLGGPPGNGFDLPVSAALSSRLAMQMVGGGGLLFTQEPIPLPYLWLWTYAPITRLAAVPTRAALPGMLCLVVIAGTGLVVVLNALKGRWRPLVSGLAAIAILFEFMPAPYPMRDLRVPRFYRELARRPGRFAVAEVPLFGDYMVYMYYQTVHHKPLLAGHVSRLSPHALDFVRGNALLRELQPERSAPAREPVLKLTRTEAFQQSEALVRASYAAAAADAARQRVRLIVVHSEMVTPADIEALQWVLHDGLGLPFAQEGEGIIAYRLPAADASGTNHPRVRPADLPRSRQ